MSTTITSPTPRTDSRFGIAIFLLITFSLSWLPFIPVLFGQDPVGDFLMPFAPAIAAVVVRRWVTREGFGDAALRPNLRRWPMYVLAVTWPILTIFLSVPLALLLGTASAGFSLPWGIAHPDAWTLIGWVAGSIAIAPIILGEEFGWRGYLQVRLLPSRPWWAAILTGLIWGSWHYPWIFASDQFGYSWALALPVFTAATITLSIFLGWLRIRTGDIWSASVGHGTNNVTEDSWHRLAFTGDKAADPGLAADATGLATEAIVLVGIVAFFGMRRSGRTARKVAGSTPADISPWVARG